MLIKEFIKENEEKIKYMVKENIHIQMEDIILVVMLMVIGKDTECLHFRIKEFTEENEVNLKNMAKED